MTEEARIRASARCEPGHAGLRLDQVAADLFSEYSRARLQKWIRSGELTVDGHEAKPTYRVCAGEELLLDALVESEPDIAPQEIPLDIIHEDSDIIVLNKPAGLVVHPAAGNPDGTLQNGLLHFDEALAGVPRSGLVHRLDKETSGVMVVARNLRAHASLVEQLQSRSMSRVYHAVAVGEILAGGTIEAPIGRHPRDRKRMAVVAAGKPAVSHYRVIEGFGIATYVEVSLETGRTHQIRVHFAHIGHALLGDPVYGRRLRKMPGAAREAAEFILSFSRQALHARTLELNHPGSGNRLTFEAPLAADFFELLQALRRASE